MALAFARAVGEYGSIVFISGNMPMKTEIVPLLIVTKLEQYDYAGATAIALVMLAASFVHAAGHQRAAGLDPHARRQANRRRANRIALRRTAPGCRRTLIGVTLGFLALFVVRARSSPSSWRRSARGSAAYFEAVIEPETRAAIKLTLITAAICGAARTSSSASPRRG